MAEPESAVLPITHTLFKVDAPSAFEGQKTSNKGTPKPQIGRSRPYFA